MNYIRDEQDLEACPSCGSGRIVCLVKRDMGVDFCMACHKAWERLPAGEPYTVDGEQMPFHVPCDNCAFRGKSQERLDIERWKDLQQELSLGGQFYCHKAVPFDAADPERERGFQFPLKDKTIELGGTVHPYSSYDIDHMRLCRGYLNAFIAPLIQEKDHGQTP